MLVYKCNDMHPEISHNDDMISMNEEDVRREQNDIELRKVKNDHIENMYTFFMNMYIFFIKWISTFLKCSSIYVLWICLHYFSAHLYVSFCVPNTMVGFFMSPFMISTPHCQGLRWIVYNAASIVDNMWLLVGTWLYSLFWVLENK